jgi:hypothetical protein
MMFLVDFGIFEGDMVGFNEFFHDLVDLLLQFVFGMFVLDEFLSGQNIVFDRLLLNLYGLGGLLDL